MGLRGVGATGGRRRDFAAPDADGHLPAVTALSSSSNSRMSCGRSRWLVSLCQRSIAILKTVIPAMDVFDADAGIGSPVPGHPLGRRVAALFDAAAGGGPAGAGPGPLLPAFVGETLPAGAAADGRVVVYRRGRI